LIEEFAGHEKENDDDKDEDLRDTMDGSDIDRKFVFATKNNS